MLCLALAALSCAEPRPAISHNPVSEPARSQSVSPSATPVSFQCTEPSSNGLLPNDLEKGRRAALELLVNGHPREAATRLSKILNERPHDVPAFVLREASVNELGKLHKDDARFYASVVPMVISEVPTGYVLHGKSRVTESGSPIQLKLASVGKEKPWTGDTDALEVVTSDFSPGSIHGETVSSILPGTDEMILVFGDHLISVSSSDDDPSLVLDLEAAVAGPAGTAARRGILGAHVVDRTLIVELGQSPGTAPNETDTGYLMAIDIDSQKVLWSSEAQIANTDFVVTGSYAVCGFTKKDGSGTLTAVDLSTGKSVSRVDLKASPTKVVAASGKILAYSPNADLTATIEVLPHFAPSRASGLAVRAHHDEAGIPGLSCVLSRAMTALDRRDGEGALKELSVLASSGGSARDALSAAASFVIRAKAHDPEVIDLTAAPAVPLHPALFDSTSNVNTSASPKRLSHALAPRLLQIRSAKAVAGTETSPAPISPVVFPPAPFTAPETYGTQSLYRNESHGEESILQYGGRYVAVLRGRETRGVFDVGIIPVLSATYGPVAVVEGDSLFLTVVAQGPSTELGGQKEFVSAYDVKTGQRLWKSAPLVSNVGIIPFGDYLITARGFGQEKASINVLRTDTGEVAVRVALRSEPRSLVLTDKTLTVACASEIVTYDIR